MLSLYDAKAAELVGRLHLQKIQSAMAGAFRGASHGAARLVRLRVSKAASARHRQLGRAIDRVWIT